MELFKLFGSIMVDSADADKSIAKTDGLAEGLGSRLGGGIKTAALFGAALGGAAIAAGAGMLKMATSSAETTDRIDKLSQKIGMSREGFQEMDFVASQSGMAVESLQVGFKTLRGAMEQAEKGTGKGAEAFKALGVSVTDSSGSLRDQEDVFNEAVSKLQGMEDGTEKAMLATKLFGKSGQEMLPLLNGAAGSMDEMRKQAHDLGLVLSDDSVDAGVAFTDTMDQLQRSFQTAVAEIGVQFMPMITKFADFIIENMPTIQSVVSTVFDVLATAISVAVEWLTLIVDAIAGVIETVIEWVQSSSGSMDELQSMFMDKIGVIVDFFKSFFDLVKGMWDVWGSDILAVLQTAWDLIIPVFQFAFDLVMDIFKVFAALFKGDWEGAWEAVLDLLSNAWGNITEVTDKALIFIGDILVLAWNVITDVIQVALDLIESIISGAWDLIGSAFQYALDYISGLTGASFEGVKTLISEYMEMISNIIDTIWSYIKTTFENVMKFLKALITGDFEGMWQAIKDQMNNIWTTIEEIWDSVMKFFGGIDLKQVGIDIIKGLIGGITSMASSLIDSVTGVVNGAIEGAKKLLGIASPSRIFMEIGAFTGEGLINGIGSKLKAVANMGKKLAGSVIQPIGDFSMPTVNGFKKDNLSNLIPNYHALYGGRSDTAMKSAPTINQVVNIHSPKYLSPSETARLQKRAAQELALGW